MDKGQDIVANQIEEEDQRERMSNTNNENNAALSLLEDDSTISDLANLSIDPNESTQSLLLTILPPELLQIIMDYLRFMDLKLLRLVNVVCKEMATRQMIKLGIDRISFKYDFELNLFVRKMNKDVAIANEHYQFMQMQPKKPQTLTDLSDCLLRSRDIPFCNFAFYGGDLEMYDAQIFFNYHGDRIEELLVSWDKESCWTRLSTLMDILGRLAPNVKHLELLNIKNVRVAGEVSKDSSWDFPNLVSVGSDEKLCFISENPLLVTELVTAATKLKKYDAYFGYRELLFVDFLIYHKKMDTIKKYVCQVDAAYIDYFEKFANANPKLEQIALALRGSQLQDPFLVNRVTSSLSKILENSKDTMNLVQFWYPIGFLRDIRWPIMENVETLAISINHIKTLNLGGFEQCLFPWGCNKIFPALKEIIIREGNVSGSISIYEDYFLFNENLPTVKSVYLVGDLPDLWLQNLQSTLPSVTKLDICELKDFPKFRKLMLQFPRLKRLRLGIYVGHENEKNVFPALDAAFTGFSPEFCREWADTGRRSLDVDMEKLRVNPSILNLKELKHLTIWFEDKDEWAKESYQLLSGPLIGQCAFKLMPKLEVRVLAQAKAHNIQKMMESLESMKPYVNEVKIVLPS